MFLPHPALPVRASVAVVALAVLILGAGCKGTESIPTHSLSNAITIDGQFDDWEQIPISYMYEDHASIRLAADDQALYAQFVTDSMPWVRAIRLTGLTLILNRDASKDDEFFISYRGGPTGREGLALSAPEGTRPAPDVIWEPLKMQLDTQAVLTCFVRDWIVEKEIPIDGSQGPAAAYGETAGRTAYEFRVPLGSSEALYYRLGAGQGQELGLGIIWGDMEQFMLRREVPAGQGLPQGGGTDQFGGTGGMGRGGYPEGFNPPEKQEAWFKTRLPGSAKK